MSRRHVFRVRVLVFVLALILVASGIVNLFINNGKVLAGVTDNASNQCDQNYAFCRSKCERDDSKCWADCRTAYDACRRRGSSDR